MQGYRSGLKYYLKSINRRLSQETEDNITAFISGFQRTVSDAREAGDIVADEGKQPLSISQYQFLAKLLLIKNTRSVESHTHFVIQFNGMSRNSSIAAMAFSHFFLSNDCIAFKHVRHKG